MSDEANAEAARRQAEQWPEVDATADSQFVLAPSAAHRINLGPPWEVAPVAGGVRHARKFGWLRPLGTERLWLICDRVPGPTEVRVNDAIVGRLDAPGPFAADITTLVQSRNEVVLSLPSDVPLGEVCLEVRPS